MAFQTFLHTVHTHAVRIVIARATLFWLYQTSDIPSWTQVAVSLTGRNCRGPLTLALLRPNYCAPRKHVYVLFWVRYVVEFCAFALLYQPCPGTQRNATLPT